MAYFGQSYCACFPIWSHCFFCGLSCRRLSLPFLANPLSCLVVVSWVFLFLLWAPPLLDCAPLHLTPKCSPHTSHQAPHQCKGPRHPAKGKLLHHLALRFRYHDRHIRRGCLNLCWHCIHLSFLWIIYLVYGYILSTSMVQECPSFVLISHSCFLRK